MATLKYNLVNGIEKFVVREDRISCLCCDPIPDFCCMYPINMLNKTFTTDDWPEEGIFYDNYIDSPNLSGPITLAKTMEAGSFGSVPNVAIYGTFVGSYNRAIYYFPTFPDEYHGQAAQIDPGLGECLFDDPFDPEDTPVPFGGSEGQNAIWLFDNFQDTYNVECTTTIDGVITVTNKTVTRESLCVWRSRNLQGDVDAQLYYRTLATEQEAAAVGLGKVLWAYNGQFRSDEGPYNSPEGTYGDCVVTGAE